MTLHPSIQHRAQAELSTALGTRLPTLADRAVLPYVNALVLEVLRWQPVVPLGLAHRLTEDDVYRGWVVPKGTVVWANIWCVDVFNIGPPGRGADRGGREGRCCTTRRCSRTRRRSGRSGSLQRTEPCAV